MLFIFDWDGTLIDSTEKIVGCMQAAASALDLPARDHGEVKSIIGLGLPEAIATLFPGIRSPLAGSLIELYSAYFVEADQVPCEFYPHVVATLKSLREEGHQLAVATGKSRRGLQRVLKKLHMIDFFDASRCADETVSKPHPMMLEQLLEELGFQSSSAVMVGDTEFDLEMAARIGMRRIGVSYGAHDVERLRRHSPELIIDDLNQLLSWRS
jgi:phosphoglycolate phosphatase|tara:strand:- start:6210 stop:6845 length:636 start_codon:yes stop_codon:yes gene_type:complete